MARLTPLSAGQSGGEATPTIAAYEAVCLPACRPHCQGEDTLGNGAATAKTKKMTNRTVKGM